MDNQENRDTLDRYWETTMAHDLKKAHEFYRDDIVVEFPQSGERIRGKQNIYELRARTTQLKLLIKYCGFVEMEISGQLN